MSDYMTKYGVGIEAGRRAYADGYTLTGNETVAFDAGYWAAHDAAYHSDSGGIEEGYGNFYDLDAVSQGMYDDDPNVYSGTGDDW